ncbi:MAG: sodium:solute symporter [Planctomycetaceae bacterium]|nr:sodium:solute symporter [Planctomycetaceae bacterium]
MLLFAFIVYTLLLFGVAWVTSRKADNQSYFTGNRKSNWMLVAYGMLGSSLSGVTFMSVPGNVMKQKFFYVPMVLGFAIGYLVIAFILLPLYYRMNLTSIYTYLQERFGQCSYKTGASFFILSRMLGATLRTFLVVFVLYEFILGPLGIPFWLAGVVFVGLAILYTFYGGIKTIIWTDSLQTTFIILGVVVVTIMVCRELGFSFGTMLSRVFSSEHAQIFDSDWGSKTNWVKRLVAGVFTAIAMTGLDQSMMQKSLSCKNIRDAQKNILTMTVLMGIVNMLFLSLGALLTIYVLEKGVEIPLLHSGTGPDTDKIFPIVALQHLGPLAGLCFFIGVISAAYPSCANALTSITTSVCIDMIEMDKKQHWSEARKKRVRMIVQLLVAAAFLVLIVAFNVLKNDAIINMVFKIAAFTYGPLLGLFLFGICTSIKVRDPFVPAICVLSPVLCYLIEFCTKSLYNFEFEFSLLLVNAALTMLGLLCVATGHRASGIGHRA